MKYQIRSVQSCRLAVAALVSLALVAACDDATEPGGGAKAGTIRVTAATTGPDTDSDGYLVIMDGGATPVGRLGANASVFVGNLREGLHEVWLHDVAGNCTVAGPNPQTVAVVFRETATITFAVTCAGRSTVRITTETIGSPPDPDGYIARVEGTSSITSESVPTSGTAEIAVAPGRYGVSLLGVAGNCNVMEDEDNPPTRYFDVAAYSTVAISFGVACAPIAVPQLVFVRAGRIYGLNADGTGLIRLSDGPGDADPSWSPDGRRIAFARKSGGRDSWGNELQDIYLMDAYGSHVVQLTNTGYGRQPTWSPDGRKVAFADRCDGQGCIQVAGVDSDETNPVRLGFDRGFLDSPAWSPDGSKIAFTSDWRAFDFLYDLYVINADGSGVKLLAQGPFFSAEGSTFYFQPAWSPDGRKIAVVVCGYDWDNCYPSSSVAVMNADGTGLTAIAATGGFARPTWSPSGGELAFSWAVCRACSSNIYRIRADGTDKRLLIADGHSPSWRR